ncbi:transposase, partial [Elizabethkingia anophelis]|uniref:transposase n=1 Tax=Elizabethkingia anophelis TaxID=1117645 RepID=UPI0016296187
MALFETILQTFNCNTRTIQSVISKKIIEESSVLKELKTQEDVSRLLKDLHSDLLESMLSGELESHLGYAKNEKSEGSNARNGTTTKRLKTEFGESIIEVPRDREGSF